MYKLIAVKRSIQIYECGSNNLETEFEITLTINELKDIVIPKDNDEVLHLPYMLTLEQVIKMKTILRLEFTENAEKYYYVLDCEGIYDWNSAIE